MKVYDMPQHLVDGSTNPQWLDLRAGHLTGSDFHQYMGMAKTGKLSETARKELYKKVLENYGYRFDNFQTPAMLIGIEREPKAREAYSFVYGKDIQEVGFVDLEDLHAGCSPDGIVYGEDGKIAEIVEIKCPSVENFVSYLDEDFMKPEYETQVQFNMFVTGAEVCHFVVYHPDFDLIVRDIPKDPEIQDKIKNVLEALNIWYNKLAERVEEKRLETVC